MMTLTMTSSWENACFVRVALFSTPGDQVLGLRPLRAGGLLGELAAVRAWPLEGRRAGFPWACLLVGVVPAGIDEHGGRSALGEGCAE
jgi:hypothetical protein